MPSFRTSHVVKHTPQQMFDLVADVESYPQFVPLCQSLRVRRRFAGQGGSETLIADMEVGYKAIKEKFASRVALDRDGRRIDVEYVDGPFSHLENSWLFAEAEGGQCRVDFFIAYEFRSRALATLMGHMFDAAFRKFASAFEERADQVLRTAPGS
ncbi:type II toxin-antitoxin system RatA family toxin [Rhodoblastus sp.]|uniref:type II toxin-antitoxin system RatA family toxin n=1 Tax=Rhodoblastus sp. TaxID=1962975 RepID=UPI003F9C5025